uniref:C-type lectin ctl-mannose binding n=1 Tax=Daphnia magna TaxID=35525 RepID=A0A0P5RW38_9CRUS
MLATEEYGWRPVFVDNEVVIGGPFGENFIWQFETQEDRILAFNILDGNIKEAQDFLSIHDGADIYSPNVLLGNDDIIQFSRKGLSETLYTTTSKATVQFAKTPISHLKLRIQKAANCSYNIKPETQCGRMVDEVSCYCAVFTNKNQSDHTMSCVDNGMKLVSFESKEEEELVHRTWSTQIPFWTSLTDTRRDGSWIWESTMTLLSNQNYTNWFPGRPLVQDSNQLNCMLYGGSTYSSFWGDVNCSTLANAICEAQP